MSMSIVTIFNMSYGLMCHVNFKNSPCHHVKIRGQWPFMSYTLALTNTW